MTNPHYNQLQEDLDLSRIHGGAEYKGQTIKQFLIQRHILEWKANIERLERDIRKSAPEYILKDEISLYQEAIALAKKI